ncbi:hypothetical protein PVAND_016998 [Polypedilum vanderplanki]|uniref:C2H2-type domain-containing protein n=1 Tax=Polypedilum vanderplanki TaxID=319348 RepID=A0A9J6BH12_POLVA|nr:hypothetical protein PVAND_016998 [Polypedilum vanderplanki]
MRDLKLKRKTTKIQICFVCNLKIERKFIKEHIIKHFLKYRYDCQKCRLKFKHYKDYQKHKKDHSSHKNRHKHNHKYSKPKENYHHEKNYKLKDVKIEKSDYENYADANNNDVTKIQEMKNPDQLNFKKEKDFNIVTVNKIQPFKPILNSQNIKQKNLSNRKEESRSYINKKNFKEVFYCKKCDQSFLHKGSFSTHKKHHDGFRFWCDTCGFNYKDNENLNIHIKKKHQNGKISIRINKNIKKNKTVTKINPINQNKIQQNINNNKNNKTKVLEEQLNSNNNQNKQLEEKTSPEKSMDLISQWNSTFKKHFDKDHLPSVRIINPVMREKIFKFTKKD